MALRGILSQVAEQLHRTLTGFSESIVEPTDDGYLRGYNLELQAVSGEHEHRLVFVELGTAHAHTPGVLEVPIEGEDRSRRGVALPERPRAPRVVHRDRCRLGARRPCRARGCRWSRSRFSVVSYRPGRRAVVRVDSASQRIFLKVVEPGKAESIAERHELFSARAACPFRANSAGRPTGLIAMCGLPGVEAQAAISIIDDPRGHSSTRSSFSARCSRMFPRSTPRASRSTAGSTGTSTCSAAGCPMTRTAWRPSAGRSRRGGAEGFGFEFTPVTVHGDLHLGQLFVDPETPNVIAGILDIDTAGRRGSRRRCRGVLRAPDRLGRVARGGRPVRPPPPLRPSASGWPIRGWRAGPATGTPAMAARARAIAATHLLGHALQPRGAGVGRGESPPARARRYTRGRSGRSPPTRCSWPTRRRPSPIWRR
ncbi:MAG: hypothetical protein WDM88_13605 [Galbitalea sp.]